MIITDLDKYKATPVDADYPPGVRTFYSPVDDVHGALVATLAAAKQSIVISAYGYDDDELAAMVDTALKNPAIYVQITLDKSQAGGVHERALLAKYSHEMTGNSVAIGTSEKGAIIHRKMMIVDGVWLCTGSTNWSTSGETLQDNELTIRRNATAAAEARHILDLSHTKALKDMAKARA